MILTTERLQLREFVPDDWKAVLAYQADPRYLQYYAWTHRLADEVKAFVQQFIEQQKAQPRCKYQFALILQAENKLIGNCGIRLETADSWEADIGYELAPSYWGYGYATEAAWALLAFGFDVLKLHRIWAHCLATNIASARVLEKLGMKREGRLRENEWLKGVWHDTLLYAILEDQWYKQTN